MKHGFAIALLAAAGVGATAPAFADEPVCEVAADRWMDEAKVRDVAKSQGWIVTGIDKAAGCWRVSGTDGWGMKFSAYVDPETGNVAKMEY